VNTLTKIALGGAAVTAAAGGIGFHNRLTSEPDATKPQSQPMRNFLRHALIGTAAAFAGVVLLGGRIGGPFDLMGKHSAISLALMLPIAAYDFSRGPTPFTPKVAPASR